MTPRYLIQLDEIKDHTLTELVNKITETPGLPLATMTHMDYLFQNDEPIFPGNGVYIFKINGEVVYVGKCGSRSFIERIPAHLDFRELAWMNSLLKAYCKRNKVMKSQDELINAAKTTLEEVRVVLINFNSPGIENIKWSITRLEDILLRSELKPWNKRKHVGSKEQGTAIKNLINL